MVQMFIASIITYRLTFVSCPDLWFNKFERILFYFFQKGRKLFGEALCLYPKIGIGWTRDALTEDAKINLRLRHLWLYLNGVLVWSPHVRFCHSQLSLMDIGQFIQRRSRLGD